jgi:outer membrane protein OmpA-like peptidoglycan-associated protein
MRKLFAAISVTALAVGGSSACATKALVRRSTSDLNVKVDSLGRVLEQTQERTRRNERRISEVDQKAQSAQSRALAAGEVAASAAAVAFAAGAKVDAVDKSSKRLGYDLVLSEDEGQFTFGDSDLPKEARSRIDSLMAVLTKDPKNVFIEIEGHTDNVGDASVNSAVGLRRARSVQRYLYEKYQIPLHRMSVISYGEDKPVASNSTKAGRAQNRRVVLRIVA